MDFKGWIRQFFVGLLVTFFILETFTPLSASIAYFNLTNAMRVERTHGIREKHITAYNADAKEIEEAYLDVRKMIGVSYVNDRVRVVRKTNLFPDGSIGKIGRDEVLGIYCANVIVYDGDPITLRHELAHFFYEKMKDSDRSEMFAQSVEHIYLVFGMLKLVFGAIGG